MQKFLPKPYKKEALTVRVDAEKLRSIDKLLQCDNNLTRSEVVNQCIGFALENMDRETFFNNVAAQTAESDGDPAAPDEEADASLRP